MSKVRPERRAESALANCRVTRFPVNLEKVTSSLDLEVMYEDLGPEVSGVLVSSSEGVCIVVHKQDHPNRQRFSICHEIGHHVLGHEFQDGGHVHVDRGFLYRDGLSSKGTDSLEIEANKFAAALLMPAKWLRERAAELSNKEPLRDQHVRILAEEFSVSEQAMLHRLDKLKIA